MENKYKKGLSACRAKFAAAADGAASCNADIAMTLQRSKHMNIYI